MVKKVLRFLGIISLATELILLGLALFTGNGGYELTAWFMGLFLVPIGIILLSLSFITSSSNSKETKRVS